MFLKSIGIIQQKVLTLDKVDGVSIREHQKLKDSVSTSKNLQRI